MDNKNLKKILKAKVYYNEEKLINKIKEVSLNKDFTLENLEFLENYIHKSKKKEKYHFNYKKESKIKKKIKKLIRKNIYLDNLNNNNKINNKDDEENNDEENNDEDSIDDIDSFFENLTNTKYEKIKSKYKYPDNIKWNPYNNDSDELGPYGTQWYHDKQTDDILDEPLTERGKIYDKLRAVILPEQRSKEWFDMRNGAITASDIGTVLGDNKYEKVYEFIVKKVYGRTFTSNEHCYHGKMLEEPATMAYQYRMNVTVEEFGLMMHPKYRFLGASPDGIVNKFKLDGKHKTKYVGRMLEIKCPKVRKIKMDGPIKNHICPIYYWDQVQLQLECCNLEECDFWQCKITLYKTREDFLDDTDEKEPFRSKLSGQEKGCLLQLMPLSRTDDIKKGKYLQAVYEDAKFLYPKDIEMTPYDCDMWVAKMVGNLNKEMNKVNIRGYYFDKVVYWKIEHTKNVTINRDREWFSESLKTFRHIWSKVEFFRAKKNKDLNTLFKRYLDSLKKRENKKIMKVVEELTSEKLEPEYISNLLTEIEDRENKKNVKNDMDDYMFV
jgi:putative phage-type endonuclease